MAATRETGICTRGSRGALLAAFPGQEEGCKEGTTRDADHAIVLKRARMEEILLTLMCSAFNRVLSLKAYRSTVNPVWAQDPGSTRRRSRLSSVDSEDVKIRRGRSKP